MMIVLADDRLHGFIGGGPLVLEELRARYQRLAAGSSRPDETWLNWIVRRSSDSQAVGTVQATITDHDDRRTAHVAWVIGVPWQNHGFASRGGANARGMVPPARCERDHRPHPSPPSGVGDRRRASRPRADRRRS
jgi:hypothetical protein